MWSEHAVIKMSLPLLDFWMCFKALKLIPGCVIREGVIH